MGVNDEWQFFNNRISKLHCYLQSAQIPFTTISACLGVKPTGSFTSGTVTSSRQMVLLQLSQTK